jgi:hypothetical protein
MPLGVEDVATPCNGAPQTEHGMRVAPLSQAEKLMRGMNMVSRASPGGFWFHLENGTKVWESAEPYWFKEGFDEDLLKHDLDALQTMGVRYVRCCALIFQFMNWNPITGYTGLNASTVANFDQLLEELSYRQMILTVTFLTPLWSMNEHPSLLEYYRVFNSSTGMSSGALSSIRLAMVDFVDRYQSSQVIFSWDLVGGFSEFIGTLLDTTTGFSLDVDVTSIFNFVEDTAEDIRGVVDEQLVTMSDDWPGSFGEESWQAGLVPTLYNKSLLNLVDYVSLRFHSDNATLPTIQHTVKPVLVSEIASTQPFTRDRRVNSDLLLDAYTEAVNKGYSGFAPWEFSRTTIVSPENETGDENQDHLWTWDALLLFTLYRNDTVSFLNTTDYSLLATQPAFDVHGHVTIELSLLEDVSHNGIAVTLASRNLIMSNEGLSNCYLNTSVIHLDGQLNVLGTANALVKTSRLERMIETGISIENCTSWIASVGQYGPSRIRFNLNSSEPADVSIENGAFGLLVARNYRVVVSDLSSEDVWEGLAQADECLKLCFDVEAGSMLIRVSPLAELLDVLSIGTSILVIVVSIVVYFYIDRKGT